MCAESAMLQVRAAPKLFLITFLILFKQAIWNTNAFFAYVISVKVFQLKWEVRRLAAVLLATLGVTVVVYGGSRASPNIETISTRSLPSMRGPSAPLVGDVLTLIASVGYALYQVLYKKYAALPSDPEVVAERIYEQLPNSDDSNNEEEETVIDLQDAVYPTPFGLYPNALTSAIGVCTFLALWIPIPILHYSGTEPFSLPPTLLTLFAIAGVAVSGVVFNAGFMVSLPGLLLHC